MTPDTAVDTYRKALVAQPDHSVVIASIGYFENLQALLESPPDAVSPLTGAQLVAQKVKMLVAMAGGYPSIAQENNLEGNTPAAQYVAADWPTKLVWSGYEVGNNVHAGQTISAVHPSWSPVRAAYEAFVGANNWIYSWDLTAVYHAIRPSDPALTETGPGTSTVTTIGGDTFAMGTGNQYYLTLTNASGLDASLESLLDTLPGGPLPNDTFDSNSLSPTLWTTTSSGSTVAAVNQQLQITHPAGSWTSGQLLSSLPYNATGHATQVQLIQAANGGQGASGRTGGETSVTLQQDATHYAQIFIGGGEIAAQVDAGSGQTTLSGALTYNASTMQWLRIRESSGTLYFEYAAGASSPGTWTTLAQVADPFPVTSVTYKLGAGSDNPTADTTIFDNVSTS